MIIFSNVPNNRAAELAALRLFEEGNDESDMAEFVANGVSYLPLDTAFIYAPQQYHDLIRARLDDENYCVIDIDGFFFL